MFCLVLMKIIMQCDAIAIRELCESRDSCDDLMFERSELHIFTESLYTV